MASSLPAKSPEAPLRGFPRNERVWPRAAVSLEITLESDSEFFVGFSENLS